MNTKSIQIKDDDITKKFTVKPLKCMLASKLILNIAKLIVNDNSYDSFIIQQTLHNALQTGVEVEGVTKEQIQSFYKKNQTDQIKSVIISLLNSIDDTTHDDIVNKFLTGVVYHNGSQEMSGNDAYDNEMIKEVPTLYKLIYEVAIISFGGVISNLGKLVNSTTSNETVQQ